MHDDAVREKDSIIVKISKLETDIVQYKKNEEQFDRKLSESSKVKSHSLIFLVVLEKVNITANVLGSLMLSLQNAKLRPVQTIRFLVPKTGSSRSDGPISRFRFCGENVGRSFVVCSHDPFFRTNKKSSIWHQNDHAKFVGAFHLSRRLSDENRTCSIWSSAHVCLEHSANLVPNTATRMIGGTMF